MFVVLSQSTSGVLANVHSDPFPFLEEAIQWLESDGRSGWIFEDMKLIATWSQETGMKRVKVLSYRRFVD